MSLLASLAASSLLALGLLLLAAQFAAYAVGYWLGRRRSVEPENVQVVVGGMLALLAFVLALTLSFASARFNERRAGTLAEANAIGTAWLRAQTVGGDHGREIGKLLVQYAQVRERFARAARNSTAIPELNRQTNALQSEMWTALVVIATEQPNPISASLMSALNDVFDTSTTERFAFEWTLPPQIFWLLAVLMLVSTGSIGYQLGVKGAAQFVLVLLLCSMWTAVVVNILDLASARLGNFQTDVSAYEWTLQGFSSGTSSPAADPAPK